MGQSSNVTVQLFKLLLDVKFAELYAGINHYFKVTLACLLLHSESCGRSVTINELCALSLVNTATYCSIALFVFIQQ